MKKYILWDHDGVLVDTEHWYFQATQHTLARLGIDLPLERYLKRMVKGLNSWDLAREAGVDENIVLAKQEERDVHYREHLVTQDIEIPGVMNTLQTLAQHFRMAIVTTSKGRDFEVIHRDRDRGLDLDLDRDIVSYMDFVLVREDYDKSKPSPEPYLLAMSRFNTTPDECLVVEDSQRGLASALAAGIDCAIVHNDFTASHDFTGAKYHLDTITDLPGILGV